MHERFLGVKDNVVRYYIKNDQLIEVANSMHKQLTASIKTNPLPEGAKGYIAFEENKFKAKANDDGLLVFLTKWANYLNTYFSSIVLGGSYVNVCEEPNGYTPKVLH